jgi:plastocyanin
MRFRKKYLPWLACAAIATVSVPAFASGSAAPGPAVAEDGAFTVFDFGFYDTASGNQLDNTVNITPGARVTFTYPVNPANQSVHNVDFGDGPAPTSCTQTAAPAPYPILSAPPLPLATEPAGWAGYCTFNTPGTYTFFCQAHDYMTGTIIVSNAGTPTPTPTPTSTPTVSTTGNLSGTVSPTLALSLGSAAGLGDIAPGFTRDYMATVDATVTSTAGNATLSVSDPSTTAPGHLVNGEKSLANPLMAMATNAAQPTSAFQPISSNLTPVTLLSYPKEIALDLVTITFKQSIADTEALRSGTYSKTLTFTLSTTMP